MGTFDRLREYVDSFDGGSEEAIGKMLRIKKGGNVLEILANRTEKNYHGRIQELAKKGKYMEANFLAEDKGYALNEMGIVVPADHMENQVGELRDLILGDGSIEDKVKAVNWVYELSPDLRFGNLDIEGGFKNYEVRGHLKKSIEEGDTSGLMGKCTLYFDPKTSSVCFDVFEHPTHRLRPGFDVDKIWNGTDWDNVGYHADLVPDKCSAIGGAFYLLHPEEMQITGRSQGFGAISPSLVAKCLPDSIELKIDKSIKTVEGDDMVFQFGRHLFGDWRSDCPDGFFSSKSSESNIATQIVPDDDIPF